MKKSKRLKADPQLLEKYLADHEDRKDRHTNTQTAINLIDICAQQLARPERLDIRLEHFLRAALQKIAVADDPAKVVASAFGLQQGKGRTKTVSTDEKDFKIAIEIERAQQCGEKYIFAVSNAANVFHISEGAAKAAYTKYKLAAKAQLEIDRMDANGMKAKSLQKKIK